MSFLHWHGTWIELGCAPDFDQGIKLSGKVPFVTFEQLGKGLPSDKAQTDYRNIILEIKPGLQIGHFEKNSRAKKLKTQGKNSRTQEKNSGF